MITFGPKLNRRYSLYLPFDKDHVTLDVFFSKINTFIGFFLDREINQKARDGELKVSLYRDLKQSMFATTFLDLKDFKSNTLDIRNQFHNVKSAYKSNIHYIANETVKISKVTTNSGVFDNVLFVYILSFSNYTNDFFYVIAERQHIDVLLSKKLVRTSAIQIGTNEACENLSAMVKTVYGCDNIEESLNGNNNTFHSLEDELK